MLMVAEKFLVKNSLFSS